jgi:hypothetical protein
MKTYSILDRIISNPTYTQKNLTWDLAEETCEKLNANDPWFTRYTVVEDIKEIICGL